MDQQQRGSRGVAGALLRFSLPLMLSGILQQLYNWADAFLVGNVEGELALAAVGATTTVVNFYLTAITGFSLGLSILAAQKYGGGEDDAIAGLLSTFSVFLGGAFLVLAGLGMLGAPHLLQLLHTTADTVRLAGLYLRIVLAGIPFLAVYNVYAAILRGMGDSRAAFYSVLLSSVLNVGLDVLFVAGFGWSVAGAAVATVISQAAMTVFLVRYSVKQYPMLRFRLGKAAWDGGLWRHGCRFGIPPMLQSSVSSVGSLILQNFMNGFGTPTVAAVTTAYRVDSIIMVPVIHLGSGIATLVAQDCGSGRRGRTKRILLVGAAVMSGVALGLMALVIPMGGRLIALFGAGREAIAIGDAFFRAIAGFYLVYGLATVVRSYLEGMGDVVYASVAGMVSLLCRIAASYALAPVYSNRVIAYAEGISWVALLVFCTARMVWNGRRRVNPPRGTAAPPGAAAADRSCR